MPNATYGLSLSIGGVTIQPASIVRTGDHPNVFEVPLPPGTGGTLSTRTDDDTGVITAAGHALQVGDKVNVYWSGGRRYGMTVSAVAGNDVTVGTGAGEVGSGDVFPAQSTAVVITKQVQINSQIDGDAIQIIGIMAQSADPNSTTKVNVDMQDSGNASIEVLDLTANQPVITDVAGGATNIYTGNVIEKTLAANGSSTETITLKLLSLEDSTP